MLRQISVRHRKYVLCVATHSDQLFTASIATGKSAPSTKDSGGLGSGAIAGIVLGALAVVRGLAIGMYLVLAWRRRRNRNNLVPDGKRDKDGDGHSNYPMTPMSPVSPIIQSSTGPNELAADPQSARRVSAMNAA